MRSTVVALAFAAVFTARAWELSATNQYSGMCDASGAVAINEDLFVIADDEDNKLRFYHSAISGPPVKIFDPTGFLHVEPREPEVDLEGAARLGDRVYWITSHGRNRHAKYRESRLRFFATDIVKGTNGIVLKPAGRYYAGLLLDLFNDPRLEAFHLAAAAQFAPKARGGFNIEGLSATPDGRLVIGFRNPIPRKKALMIPLLNPAEAIEGKTLRLGAPWLVDLGGRGIRSMALYQNKFLIIAGSYDETPDAKLFLWAGGSSAPVPIDVRFGDFNPEALAIYPGRPDIQLFSDDGTRRVGGTLCKSAPPDQRSFRAFWIRP